MKILAHLLLILTLACGVGLDIADAAHDVGDVRIAATADAPAAPDVKDHSNESVCELGSSHAPFRHVVHVRRAPQPVCAPALLASALIPELRPPIDLTVL